LLPGRTSKPFGRIVELLESNLAVTVAEGLLELSLPCKTSKGLANHVRTRIGDVDLAFPALGFAPGLTPLVQGGGSPGGAFNSEELSARVGVELELVLVNGLGPRVLFVGGRRGSRIYFNNRGLGLRGGGILYKSAMCICSALAGDISAASSSNAAGRSTWPPRARPR